MRRISFVLLGAIILAALIAVPSSPAHAANVLCVANPGSAPVGTTFAITCNGFSPNTSVYPYVTEPDGATLAGSFYLIMPPGNKTDSGGSITYLFPTRYDKLLNLALGEWAVTVQELGVGGPVATGIGRFTVTGAPGGESGATLTVNPALVYKQQPAVFNGTGYLPNEIVSVWMDAPGGDCSSTTLHTMGLGGFPNLNFPEGPGYSETAVGNTQADTAGTIHFALWFNSIACEGTWHFVARGNTSHAGADTNLDVRGYFVTESASLVASPSSVVGLGGYVTFIGSGYGPDDPINCWETSPLGQALPVFNFNNLRANSGGSFSFTMMTGSFIPQYLIASEGALGEWSMSCRGAASNLVGIARFTIYGNMVDP